MTKSENKKDGKKVLSLFFREFRKKRLGLISLIIFLSLFIFSLLAEVIANDKPIILYYKNKIYFPIIKNISEKEIGGYFETEIDFKDPEVIDMIDKNGFTIFPPVKFSYNTINLNLKNPAPSKPSKENIFGTDDQGRDIFARILYGLRTSIIFGLILTFFTLLIGISLGAIQGYYAAKLDLYFQRFIEIWSNLPSLFILIILSSVIQPNFFTLLLLMLLFSWISVVGVVRAEFLRIRNFDFVRSAITIGCSDTRIIFSHILPNALNKIIANIPFLICGSITSLTALDFLGLGLAVDSASLGELLLQGKNNVSSYWIAISAFSVLTIILMSLVFIGEVIRDVFDQHRN
jgi:microcin C transport system permease protein